MRENFGKEFPDGKYLFNGNWESVTLPSIIYFKYIQGICTIKLMDNHAKLNYYDGKEEYITLDRLAQRVLKYV